MKDDPRLGADGTFPLGGPQFPTDEGGLYCAFGLLPGTRHGYLKFGKTLNMIGGPPNDMRMIAAEFRRRIGAKFGVLPYDVSTLPIKVEAQGKVVLCTLPMLVETLVANVEVFLALAQRIDEESAKIP